MRCIRMTVQYDGTAYHGWQEQPGLVTVQGTLAERLATILGERPAVEGASRTDAGRGPFEVVYKEPHPDHKSARNREKFLKSGLGRE